MSAFVLFFVLFFCRFFCNTSSFINNPLIANNKIFENIIRIPDNKKYQNINWKRIVAKFGKCDMFKQLMYDAGFYESDNGLRLIFDIKHLNKLENIHQQIMKQTKQPFKSKNEEQEESKCLPQQQGL